MTILDLKNNNNKTYNCNEQGRNIFLQCVRKRTEHQMKNQSIINHR